MNSNFSELKQCLVKRVDEKLASLFQSLNVPSEQLKAAMEYAVLGQGKRLRPLLVYLTGNALNIALDKLDNIACAVECMHAYSLVHDDLPAMDNDDLRRGRPTCHKAFDEATAILAGDALQALAFQQIFLIDDTIISPEQKNALAMLLSISCGPQGMVSGQALDLEHLETIISQELLKKIHYLKTGIFLETCVKLVLLTNDHVEETFKTSLFNFAQYLGLAFQIQDDYLDKYGETEVLGKRCGADEQQGKKTYAFFYSQEELLMLWSSLYQEAADALKPLGKAANDLRELVYYLSRRVV